MSAPNLILACDVVSGATPANLETALTAALATIQALVDYSIISITTTYDVGGSLNVATIVYMRPAS